MLTTEISNIETEQSIQEKQNDLDSRHCIEEQRPDSPVRMSYYWSYQRTYLKMAVQGMTDSLAGLDMTNDKTADYKKLIEYGLDAKVADKLDEIYKVEITKY